MFLFRIIVHSPRDFKLSYSWRLVRFQSSLVMTYLLLELMLLTFRYLDWSTSLGFSPFTLTCACWNYVWEILLFLMFESLYLGLGWRKISFLFLDVWESFTRWSRSEKESWSLSFFFWNGLSSSSLRYLSCEEDVFLLSWYFEDLLFDDLDQKRKIFLLLLVLCFSRRWELFLCLDFWESFLLDDLDH
jgi:hypothetical protein